MPEPSSGAGGALADYLQRLTETLAAAHTQHEVLAAALQPAMAALKALAVAVLLLDPETQALSVAAVQGRQARTVWQDGSLSPETPAGDAILGREPVYFEHAGALKDRYPHLEEHTGGIAAVATAVLPLQLEGQALGVLILDFKEPHTFSAEERRFLSTLAAQTSVALGRAQLIASLDTQVGQRTEALQRQNAELEAILNSIPEAIYVGTASGITRANPTALDMLGFPSVESLNRHIHQLAEQLNNRHPVTLERVPPKDDPFAIALQGTPHTSEVLSTHQQTGEVLLVRSAAAPIRLGDEVIGAVAVNTDLTGQQKARELQALNTLLERRVSERTAELEARTRMLEGIEQLSSALALDADSLTLIRQAQDLVLRFLPPGYAAYFEVQDGRWRVRSQVGDSGSALLQAAIEEGFPVGQTPTLDIGARTKEPFFVEAYVHDSDGQVEAAGHLNAAACLPLLVHGEVRGIFNVPLFHARTWTGADKALLITTARSLGLALERIEQTRQLQLKNEEANQRTQALEAFVAYNRATTEITDVYVLAERAIEVLETVLPDVVLAYYERAGELWQARVWSDTVTPEVQDAIRAGFPATAPGYAAVVASGAPVFVPGFDAAGYEAPEVEIYQAVAFFPCVLEGQTQSILVIGTQTMLEWSARDRQVFEAVGSSLTLALERTRSARQLQAQKEEAERRSQVLEAFAALSTELSIRQGPYELIQRAQEIVLSLLPDGHALYWEPQGGLWRMLAQTGEVGHPGLQAALDAGLVIGQTPTLDQTWASGEPMYQDQYDVERDLSPELAGHIHAVAVVPVFQGETLQGVMNFTLTEPHVWRAVDHVVLETVQQSLSLALDRLYQQHLIEQQRDEAEQRSRALEAFAVMSRDLAGETDRYVLIQRAQAIMLSLLPPGYAGYLEQEGDHWVLKSQVGDFGNPELQRLMDEQGLPLDTPALHSTWLTGMPNYQDNYTQGADTPAEMIRHVHAATAFRVQMHGQPLGMLAIGLFDQRTWTPMDKAVLETAVYSLGLILERAEQARQLEEKRVALQAFVQFTTTVASSTDLEVLARAATDVVQETVSVAPAGFYLVRGDTAYPVLLSDNTLPEYRSARQAGISIHTPLLRQSLAYPGTFFSDPVLSQEHAPGYTALGVRFFYQQGQPYALFAVSLASREWTETEKAIIESVGQALELALERREATRQLAQQAEELAQSNEDLQAANEELEAFTYSASHDLRTPVRHVMGFAELAEKALEKGQYDKVGRSLDVVKQGALRMTSLIDGMLLLSRSGRQDLHVQPVDLNTLVVQARHDVAAEFGSHPVRWQVGELPTVMGDHSLLQQVVTNLLSNAVKYSARREVSEVKIWGEDLGSEWTIRVQDNGVGFAPQYAQKLFGIFQRLHTEKEFKGTGIGLATMKRIVHKHSGRVFAESDGQTGATFGFTLPKQLT